MIRDRHVDDPTTVVRKDHKDKKSRNVTVGTTNRSAAMIWLA